MLASLDLPSDAYPRRGFRLQSVPHHPSPPSSPGPDSISYVHLRCLPGSHHFLATLFSKILLGKQSGPKSWYNGKITLIHKSGDPSLPASFTSIALTSCIGKVFHKITARCLERYLITTNIIDPSIQKGFISGVNGVMEHNFALNSLLMKRPVKSHRDGTCVKSWSTTQMALPRSNTWIPLPQKFLS